MRRRLAGLALILTFAAPSVAGAEGHGKKAKAPYVDLPTLSATILRANGAHGTLTVEIGLDAHDAALRDRIDLSVPLLRAAYVSVLQPYALSIPPGGAPNADYISMILQRQTDQVLGRRGARLLLGSILVY